jgi:hypothetical protein
MKTKKNPISTTFIKYFTHILGFSLFPTPMRLAVGGKTHDVEVVVRFSQRGEGVLIVVELVASSSIPFF